MKILVTGAAGFVGRNLIPVLENYGHEIIGTDITEEKPLAFEHLNAVYEVCDIVNRKKIARLLNQVDLVIHLAGEASLNVDNSLYKRNNIFAGSLLIEEIIKANVTRLVFLSSIKVENASSNYAISKKIIENKIINSSPNNFSYTILRCAAIYGRDMKSNIIDWLIKAKNNVLLRIPESKSTLSLIGIDDLCKIISKCIENEAVYNKTYHVSDGVSYSINQLEVAARKLSVAKESKGFKASIGTYPRWMLYLGAKFGDIVNAFGIKFPFNSSAYNIFFKNIARFDPAIFDDLDYQPTQNFIAEIPAILK